MPGPWPRRACSVPTAPTIASPIPNATCGAAWVVRDAPVQTRTRYISVVRALLRQHGYRMPSGSAEGFVDRFRGLSLPGRSLSVVAPLLALMRPLNHRESSAVRGICLGRSKNFLKASRGLHGADKRRDGSLELLTGGAAPS